MTRSNSRWIPLITLVFSPLVACGGSSTGSTPTAVASAPLATAPVATPTTSVASAQCPSASTVGSALGITVPNAVAIGGGGGTPLPGGAKGLACEYHATAYNVIIEVITNVSPSYIAKFSVHFPVPYKTVSGVGDQARSFLQALGGGKDNEGVVATKGSTLVSVGATATPASLAQVEALVNQLL